MKFSLNFGETITGKPIKSVPLYANMLTTSSTIFAVSGSATIHVALDTSNLVKISLVRSCVVPGIDTLPDDKEDKKR